MAKDVKDMKQMHKGNPMGLFFVLTYFGTLIYFIDKADGFWEVVFSFIQAFIWPALLIYKVFTMLNI